MNMGYERMVSILFVVLLMLCMDATLRVIYADVTKDPVWMSNASKIALSSTPKSKSDKLIEEKVDIQAQPVNPHWDKEKCNVCHDKTSAGKHSVLSQDKSEELCIDCHKDDIKHIYIHPIGLLIPKERKADITKKWGNNLRLDKNGKLICQTCHDLLDQCLPERSYQAKSNPRFLRDGPYQDRYSICYRCHDSSKYKRKNSHDQIDDNGQLKMRSCRLCHDVDVNKKVKSGIKKDLNQYPLLEGMNEDRTLLCIRCHRKIDHPSSSFRFKSDKMYRHLVKIKSYKKETLKKQIAETGVELPLEPNTDRIYCGTCHQPHQPGVFAGEVRSALTMENHRLRAKPICKHCHDIYGP